MVSLVISMGTNTVAATLIVVAQSLISDSVIKKRSLNFHVHFSYTYKSKLHFIITISCIQSLDK